MLRSQPTSSFDEDRRGPGVHRTLALRRYRSETRAPPPARRRCFARHGTRGTTAGIKNGATAPSAAGVEQTEWAPASLTRDPRSGTTLRCRFARGPSLRDCPVRLLITPLIPAAVAAIEKDAVKRTRAEHSAFHVIRLVPLNVAPHLDPRRVRIHSQRGSNRSSAPGRLSNVWRPAWSYAAGR
jgi:hypothetical protein